VQINLQRYHNLLDKSSFVKYFGRVSKVVGLTIESDGPEVDIGKLCKLYASRGRKVIQTEVVGFRDSKVLLMPLGDMSGVGPGNLVVASDSTLRAGVGNDLTGRVLDGLGHPIDGKGPLRPEKYYPVDNDPPHPLNRKRITDPLPLGIKAIDGLLTVGKGQRIGIFAGSGVGKSTLMGMIARNTKADVNVIALIGERGREVREFIERDLGEEGLSRSVVVVATSDQPALVRLKGAFIATAIAEYFGPGQGRAADDGLADPFCNGPAGNRACHGRTSGFQRLYSVCVRSHAKAARKGREFGKRVDHRTLYCPGGRGRYDRACDGYRKEHT